MTISGAGSPAPEGGTTGTEVQPTPPEGQGQPEFDAQRAYDELRPVYTQATQRLSEYEQLFEALQDPESQAEALARLGFEMDTGPEDVGTAAPEAEWEDPLERKVQELEAQLQGVTSERELEARQAQEQELVEARDEYIDDAITHIGTATKVKFTEREQEVLGNLAIAMTDEDGVPDVQGAYNALYGEESVLEANRQRWIDSKTGAIQAPRGASVSAETRPTSRRERIAYVDERAAAIEAQQ